MGIFSEGFTFLKFQRAGSPTFPPTTGVQHDIARAGAVKQFLSAINSRAHLLKVSVFRDVFIASKHCCHLWWSTLGCKLFHQIVRVPYLQENGGEVTHPLCTVRKCCSGFTHGLSIILLMNSLSPPPPCFPACYLTLECWPTGPSYIHPISLFPLP